MRVGHGSLLVQTPFLPLSERVGCYRRWCGVCWVSPKRPSPHARTLTRPLCWLFTWLLAILTMGHSLTPPSLRSC